VLSAAQVREIRHKADAKRAELGFGVYAPIGAKVFDLLDQLRILTVRFPLEDRDLDAFIGRRDGLSVVYVNTAIPRGRQHFAAAHELCHAWYDRDALADWDTICEIQDGGGTTAREMQANRFAAEFLVPKAAMENYVAMLPLHFDIVDRIVLLSDYFEVPAKTIILRLEETGSITVNRRKQLSSDLAVYTQRRRELGLSDSIDKPTCDRRVSPLFHAVMGKNLANGYVSRGKIDELSQLLRSMPQIDV